MKYSPTTDTPDGTESRLIGQWQDMAAYYLSSKGTVWCYHVSSGKMTNCGDEKTFRDNFATRYRGTLSA